MSTSTQPILELQQISKRFGTFVAVDDVSLAVAPGEFLTLLGASGSGKTTTLRMIAGFELPSEGEILMEGKPVTLLPPFKRDVNTVFQHYALFPHMSVADNVGYGLRMRRVPAAERTERVTKALEMVQLNELAARAPRQLSGGQQQRVALARALVNRPRVLLLDEPLVALDLKLRKEMQLELKALNKQLGITFVYVTHDQEEALTMSDRIALMRNGRIEQVSGPRELYDRPATRYVADFIGETNLLRGTVREGGDGWVTLSLGGAVVRALSARRLAPGADAWLSIRPEFIGLAGAASENGGGESNSLAGTVREAVFVGTVTKLYLTLAQGDRLVLHAPPGPALPARGQEVRVSWPSERGICVAD